jgi:hypothetical protein
LYSLQPQLTQAELLPPIPASFHTNISYINSPVQNSYIQIIRLTILKQKQKL